MGRIDATRVCQDLRAMRSADALEQEYIRRCIALATTSKAPFARTTFTPGHFTASSFVLSPDRSKLLLIFHGKLHRWLQPGGHVDPEDESPLAAARREVLEETGLARLQPATQGIFDVDIHTIPSLRGEPSHDHFDLRYLFVAAEANAVAGSDASDVRWCPLESVSPLESDESVMRAVRKIQRGWP